MLEQNTTQKPLGNGVDCQEMVDSGTRDSVSVAESPPTASPPSNNDNQGSLEASISAGIIQGKIAYFAMYTGLSASPYYGLLLENKGLKPFAVGAVVAFMPLCVLVLLPPLSYVADRYHCALKIHLCAAVVSSLLLLLLMQASSVIFVGVLMVLHFAFRTPVGTFMDQRTMSILPPDRKIEWGPMRSYGAYGWAFGALINSAAIARGSWCGLAVIFSLGIGIAMILVFAMNPHYEAERTTKNYAEVLRYIVQHRRLVVFLLALCCMGMGYTLINTFLFMFLDSINAPSILLGLSVIMTVVVEIPLFQCSKYIHEHYTDRQLLCASIFVWVVRVTGYSFLYNPWLVLFLEPLHGFTFGLMWLSGMHFVRQAFPKSLSHSSIGSLSATAFGVGPIIGNILGGALYQWLGARWMFRVMALFMLSVSVVFVTVDRNLERRGFKIDAEEEVREEVTVENVVVQAQGEEGEK